MFSHDLTAVVPTVGIRTEASDGNPDGIVLINKSDFDPKKHQLVDDGEQPSLDLEASTTPGPFSQK